MITASPGHYGPKTGAHGIIDEVTEAIKVTKRVTAILRAAGIVTNYIEDSVSKSQSKNIGWLVTQHNKTSRQLDVSIHFNASVGQHTRGIGTEVLYYSDSNNMISAKVSKAISDASGLIDRGAKKRTDVGILKNTNKPAILIEVCFVNSTVDVALYRRDFEKICQAIAKELAVAVGESITVNKPSTITDKKEVDTLAISSPALKKETDETLASKARRQLIVDAAVKVGANKIVWQGKLDDGTITDDDLLALATKAIVDAK